MDDPFIRKERNELLNKSIFQKIVIADNEIIDIDSLSLNSDDDTWLYSTDESITRTSKNVTVNQSVNNTTTKTCNSEVFEQSIFSESTISPVINNTQDFSFSNTILKLLNDDTTDKSCHFLDNTKLSSKDVTRDDTYSTNGIIEKNDPVSHSYESPILPEVKRINNRFSTITKSPRKNLQRRDTYDLSEENTNVIHRNEINGNNIDDTISPIEIDNNTFKIPTVMKKTGPITPKKSICYPTPTLGHSTPVHEGTLSRCRIGFSSSDESVGNQVADFSTYKKTRLNESYVKQPHHNETFNLIKNNIPSVKMNNVEIESKEEIREYHDRTYVADLNKNKDDISNNGLSRRSKSAEGLLSSSEESIFSEEASKNCILVSVKEQKSNMKLNVRKNYEVPLNKVWPPRRSNLMKAVSLASLPKPDGLRKSWFTNKIEQSGRPSYAAGVRVPSSSVTNRSTYANPSKTNSSAVTSLNGGYINSKMNSTFRKNKPTDLSTINKLSDNAERLNGINQPVKCSVDVTKVGRNGNEGKTSGIPRMSFIPRPSRIPAPRSSSVTRVAPTLKR